MLLLRRGEGETLMFLSMFRITVSFLLVHRMETRTRSFVLL